MHIDRSKIEQFRTTLAATLKRAREIIANSAEYRQFPHSADEATILFAQALARAAASLVKEACNPIGLTDYALDKPVADALLQSLEWHVGRKAQESGVSPSLILEAQFASVVALNGTANELVNRAVRVLEGDETLDGREIKHSPLYEK